MVSSSDGMRRRRHINNQWVIGKVDGRVDMDLVGRIGIGGKVVVVVVIRVRGGGENVRIMRGSADSESAEALELSSDESG